jgi:S1-C subfamily serine protease
MIPIRVVRKIRLATCAVHRFDVKHEEAFAGIGPGDQVNRVTSVRATAFLVRDTVLLTNRHVVEQIAAEHLQSGNHDHWYVEFVYPRTDDEGWSQTFRRIGGIFAFVDPSGSGALDVGLLSIRAGTDALPSPVGLGNLDAVVTGAAVAICGYPLGDEILTKGSLWRFGPVVHAGIISAVSPYDAVGPRSLTTFLTDINTAPGMSGSPVFLPDSGLVIGLHYAGVQGTLGCAVPVDDARLTCWVGAFESALAKGGSSGTLQVTTGGDIGA